MMRKPKELTVAKLEVIVWPNGDVMCDGVKVGAFKDLCYFLTKVRETRCDD